MNILVGVFAGALVGAVVGVGTSRFIHMGGGCCHDSFFACEETRGLGIMMGILGVVVGLMISLS